MSLMTDTNEQKWRAREIPDFDHNVFYEKTSEVRDGGCIEWLGSITSGGYGTLSIKGDNYLAHRISMHIHIGDISTSRVIDHICRNRKCVNPEHLRQVSNKMNITENSNSPSGLNKAKTHCIRGHELKDRNLMINKKTKKRNCRTCQRAVEHAYRNNLDSKSTHLFFHKVGVIKTHCKWGHPKTDENKMKTKVGSRCLACVRSRGKKKENMAENTTTEPITKQELAAILERVE